MVNLIIVCVRVYFLSPFTLLGQIEELCAEKYLYGLYGIFAIIAIYMYTYTYIPLSKFMYISVQYLISKYCRHRM